MKEPLGLESRLPIPPMKPKLTAILTTAVSLLTACNLGQTNHPYSDFGKEASKREKGKQGLVSSEEMAEKGAKIEPWNKPQPLTRGVPTYFVLQVDGGGILGITPANVLAEIERHLQKRPEFKGRHLRDLFSICCGTSTGAIISGMVAAEVPANKIASYYNVEGVELFKRKGRTLQSFIPIIGPTSLTTVGLTVPKYKRSVFQEELYNVLANESRVVARVRARTGSEHPEKITLGDPEMYKGPLLMIPAYDLCSKRTHFIRTREAGDRPLTWNNDVQLVDAISASAFSAALFFTKLDAPNIVWEHVAEDGRVELRRGAVYNDGGQGSQNSPLGLATVHALNFLVRGWEQRLPKNAQVVIISLGCGDKFEPHSYDRTKRVWPGDEVLRFFKGQAREESAQLQWRAAKSLSDASKIGNETRIKVFRFNYTAIPGSSSFEISDKKAKQYQEAATSITLRPDFSQLMSDLADSSVKVASWRDGAAPIMPESSNKGDKGLKGGTKVPQARPMSIQAF